MYPCPHGGGGFAVSLCCLLAGVADPRFHTWAARRNKHGQLHFLMESYWGNDASLVLLYKLTVFLWDKWACSNFLCVPKFSFTVLQASQAIGQYPHIPGALGLIWRQTQRLSAVYPEGTFVCAAGLPPLSFPWITGKIQGHSLDRQPMSLYEL